MSREFTYRFVCDSCGTPATSETSRLPAGWADLTIYLGGTDNPFVKLSDNTPERLVCGYCQCCIIDRVNDGSWATALAAKPTHPIETQGAGT